MEVNHVLYVLVKERRLGHRGGNEINGIIPPPIGGLLSHDLHLRMLGDDFLHAFSTQNGSLGRKLAHHYDDVALVV